MADINFMEKLLQEAGILLKEIGDLENLEKFNSLGFHQFDEHYGFAFKTELGVVDVDLIRFSKEELKESFRAYDPEKTNGYNLSYKLNDNAIQSEKTNLRFLMKILATITEKLVEFCKNVQPDFVFIFGNSKGTEGINDETKKTKLYRAIIEKNITKMAGYHVGTQSVNGNLGFLIYR